MIDVTPAGREIILFEGAEDFLNSYRIDSTLCLITDVRMPGVNGPDLVEQLLTIQPGLKCILMSANDRPDLERDVPFLSKPFSIAQLLSEVVDVLADV